MTYPLLNDQAINSVLDFPSVMRILDEALADLSQGQASIHARQRSACTDVKLSTMGAIWASRHVAGTKIYPTVGGQFSFLMTLFDTRQNTPLAVMAANELTRYRTAAMTALIARKASLPAPRKLALFGCGLQGKSQLEALIGQFKFDEIAIVDPNADQAWRDMIANKTGSHVHYCDSNTAVHDAEIIVTATRSKQAVFDGSLVKPGALISAIGTSAPDGSELDDVLLQRARKVIVEWKPQSLLEAGEVVHGLRTGAITPDKITDLTELYAANDCWRDAAEDIIVFKTVGIGLADLATALLAYQRITSS